MQCLYFRCQNKGFQTAIVHAVYIIGLLLKYCFFRIVLIEHLPLARPELVCFYFYFFSCEKIFELKELKLGVFGDF